MVPVARFELRKQHSYYGADGEDRTPNLLITNQLPYHWATSAHNYLPLKYSGGIFSKLLSVHPCCLVKIYYQLPGHVYSLLMLR